MKHILKAGCPHAYLHWCGSIAGTNKEDYREVPADKKRALLAALIAEQGAICAYTMKQINSESAHVEHIRPQGVCREKQRGSDLDYRNMVACFPRDGMRTRYRYGAQQKDDWWENDGVEFVSPLHPKCEHCFHFDLNGTITAVKNHAAAATTIRVLGLDHASLTEERKRVIEEFIYGPHGDNPLSQTKAAQAMKGICKRDGKRRFHEFCIAIGDALKEYQSSLHKLAQHKKAVRRKG